MQYAVIKREGGKNPYLVVRDADGEMMGSYPTREAAETAKVQFLQEKPYWESLISGWNRHLDLVENIVDRPQYFARTPLAKALYCYVENAYGVAEGNDTEIRVRFMEQTIRDWGTSDAVRGFRRAQPGDLIGVVRSSEQIGKYTAHMLSGEVPPVRKEALEAAQVLAAVTMDSLVEFPLTIGNPFAHVAVSSGLERLQEALLQIPESSVLPSTGSTRDTVRNMLPS